MRVLLQRVRHASVMVEGRKISEIGQGLLILLGVSRTDGEAQVEFLADKIAHLRIFEDEQARMNLSVLDVKGEALVVSQFTLYADAHKGRRPSFTDAAQPEIAEPWVKRFVTALRERGIPTQTGRFGGHMLVDLQNDGPVTLWLEH